MASQELVPIGPLPADATELKVQNDEPTAGKGTLSASKSAHSLKEPAIIRAPTSSLDEPLSPTTVCGSPTSSSKEFSKEHSTVTYKGLSSRSSTVYSSARSDQLSWKRRWIAFLNNWWYWEIGCVLMGCVMLLGTCVLLACINGMASNGWSFLLMQPSTLIAIFIELSKAAFLVSIEECISQAKWLRFSRFSQPLSQLEVYDEATRGPWGALMLLKQLRNASKLAVSGAVLTLLALGLSPFAQQVVQYGSRQVAVSSGVATLSVTQNLDQIDAVTMQGSILNGIWPFNLAPITYTCTTSNCEWPAPIVTLGVCGRCSNITERVPVTCNTSPGPLEPDAADNATWSFETTTCTYDINANISLPVYIQTITFPAADGRPAEYASQYTQYKIISPSIANNLGDLIGGDERWIATMLSYATLFNHDIMPLPRVTLELLNPSLFACGLYWCGQVYDSPTVVNGTAPTDIPSAEFQLVAPIGPDGEVTIQTETGASNLLQIPDSNITGFPAGGNSNFTVDQTSHIALTDYLEGLFNFTLPSGNDVFSVFPEAAFGLAGITDTVYADGPDLSTTFSRMARSMTGQVRNSISSYVVAGNALHDETYIQVVWGWLALPLSVALLATVLLAAMIFENARRTDGRIWKSSSIAMLLHEVDGCDHEKRDITNLEEVDHFADSVNVQLMKGEDGIVRFTRT